MKISKEELQALIKMIQEETLKTIVGSDIYQDMLYIYKQHAAQQKKKQDILQQRWWPDTDDGEWDEDEDLTIN